MSIEIEHENWNFAAAIIVAAIVGVAGLWFGSRIATARFQEQAVAWGYAEYNQTNGVWQWKPISKINNPEEK